MSTLRISNIEAKADSSSPTVDEQLKFTNSDGDVLLHLDGRTAGITTVGINTTNSTIKFDANNNILITGIVTATEFHGTLAVGTSVTYGDNEKAYFGNGLDMSIHHDGTNSIIEDSGTGNLYIKSDSVISIRGTTVAIKSADNSQVLIKGVQNAGSELYYNGNRKFVTTNTGATITGTAVADALDISGDIDVDGHTNLDNVSIAGVTTITGSGNALEIVGGVVRNRGTTSARFVVNNGSAEGYFGWSGGALTVGQASATLSLEASGSNHIQLKTGGSERLRVDSVGNVLLGLTSTLSSNNARLQVAHTNGNADIIVHRAGNNANPPGLNFQKTRNASIGNYSTIVQNNDELGSIRWGGADGSNIGFAARIVGAVDGTPGANDMPGRIQFHTSADGSEGMTERLRITSGGKVKISNHGTNNLRSLSVLAPKTQIQWGTGEDVGGFLMSENNGQFGLSGGGYWSGSNWVATHTGSAQIRHDGGGTMVFCTNASLTSGNNFVPTERLRIDSSGRVIIGGTSPLTDAQLTLSADDAPAIAFQRTGTGKFESAIGMNGNSSLRFYTGADASAISGLSERMQIDANGRVGINEASPQQQLHIHDDTIYQGILINGSNAPRIAFARTTTTTGEWSVGIDGTNGNNFCINRSNDNSNRYVVISNGQINLNQNTAITGILYNNQIVSITSTNDDQTSHVSISARNAAGGYGDYFIVGVSGNTYFGAGANQYNSNPSGNNINGGTTIRVYGGVSSNAYQDAHRFGRDTDGSIVLFQSAGGTEGSIAISGSTTNYNTSSDYRLKENIVNITDGITRLKQLKPRRFNFIKDPSITKDGFIAHEVDSIVPEAVTGTKDETFSKDDEENNIKAGDPKYQHLDASKLIPLLTAALQEEIAKREALEARISALEGS